MRILITALVTSLALLLTPPLQAASYTEQTVNNGATISGAVTFSGVDTPPKVYRVTKDNEICGTGSREIDYIKVNNGALNDVIVYLDKVPVGKPFPAEFSSAKLDQVGCDFIPFLQIMRNNSKLVAINSDPVLHNVHAYELIGKRKKTVFNVNQPQPGQAAKTVALRRSEAMKVECDAHDFMHSYVFVANNPYFARVDSEGRFSIDQIPAGSYTLKAWHSTLQNLKQTITIGASENQIINLNFK